MWEAFSPQLRFDQVVLSKLLHRVQQLAKDPRQGYLSGRLTITRFMLDRYKRSPWALSPRVHCAGTWGLR